MKVIGIDLSGPRNTADTSLVIFEQQREQLHIIARREGADDRQILESISSLGRNERLVIGIDAPLSYQNGGGDRQSDAELRRLVLAKGRGIGVLPPTMIRMVYLTLRGMHLARSFEALKPDPKIEIVEVHPGACLLLREAPAQEVALFKKSPIARRHLLDWLEIQGLKGLKRDEPVSDHCVAACAAALGAWYWARGDAVWRFPAQPPEHPYDFAC